MCIRAENLNYRRLTSKSFKISVILHRLYYKFCDFHNENEKNFIGFLFIRFLFNFSSFFYYFIILKEKYYKIALSRKKKCKVY